MYAVFQKEPRLFVHFTRVRAQTRSTRSPGLDLSNKVAIATDIVMMTAALTNTEVLIAYDDYGSNFS